MPHVVSSSQYETSVACEKTGGLQSVSENGEGLQTDENSCPGQPVAYHMVNRRYSEFLNLQTRLEEKPELRRLIKGRRFSQWVAILSQDGSDSLFWMVSGVKGPKKMFPEMPFGNMDSEKIEARKGLLETFLKVCTVMRFLADWITALTAVCSDPRSICAPCLK